MGSGNHNGVSCFAILVAAGSSTRMGGSVPKVYLNLSGKPILDRTLDTFKRSKLFAGIVIVVRPEDVSPVSEKFSSSNGPRVIVVAGGAVRQESVQNGLKAVRAQFQADSHSVVAVHDAARCLVSIETISTAVLEAQNCGAVTVAVRLVDSIKRVGEDMKVLASLSRDGVWCIQTPQVFQLGILERAHELSMKSSSEKGGATDDASLVEKIMPVTVVEGSRTNIKVTTPEDLAIAEALIKLNEQKSINEKVGRALSRV